MTSFCYEKLLFYQNASSCKCMLQLCQQLKRLLLMAYSEKCKMSDVYTMYAWFAERLSRFQIIARASIPDPDATLLAAAGVL